MAFNPFRDIEFRLIDIYIQYIKETNVNEIYLFGVTKAKQSVCCVVRDFEFHFLLQLPYENEMPDSVLQMINHYEIVKYVPKRTLGNNNKFPCSITTPLT